MQYDVIVVGAGHAGCEAAAAAATLGSKVLLITMDMNKIAQMSCNPAVGGIAKGQIVREIDALGGRMGLITDRSSIQFRMLNMSKGPAMWSPRSQSDRTRFIDNWRKELDSIDGLYIWQDSVVSLIIEKGRVVGLKTALGEIFYSRAIVLTTGTFMNGLMHIGEHKFPGGRISESSSVGLSDQLKDYGFRVARMKTGTPMRLDGRTIDFAAMSAQYGDTLSHHRFSYLYDQVQNALQQRPCWITYTNSQTHNILRNSLDRSPLYNGQIKSIGPRYCPSIETKIVTFPDKDRHQLFIEPEGEATQEYYVNGFSSSLPFDVQLDAIHTVSGLENAVAYRPGYAIEYDFFDPTQLTHSLETKSVKGLFFAGQINGTTGYEEAAGQGLIAGINAHFIANNIDDEFILHRDQSYIGVLIDDLVNKGVDEPYRMFTSRAEYRILLRQDDADMRLTPLSHKIGLVSDQRFSILEEKRTQVNDFISFLSSTSVDYLSVNPYLSSIGSSLLSHSLKLRDLLLRPNITIGSLSSYDQSLSNYLLSLKANASSLYDEIIEETEIQIKYSGYIEREKLIADKLHRLEYIIIPDSFDFMSVHSLCTEARQKLSSIRPHTIGDASRIPGVSPSDINILLLLLGR